MKIVYLNSEDKIGRRFNGFDLMLHFNSLGHEASMIVWEKRSKIKSVIKSYNIPCRRFLKVFGFVADKVFGIPYLFYPFNLIFKLKFWRADIVHLHLLGNHYFSLFELPFITLFKPTIITIHEFSLITSHCNYPADNCLQWQTGCRACPDRVRPFGLSQGTESIMWDIKKFIYKKCNIRRVVVASKWFEDQIKLSPLLSSVKTARIPFGINCELFKPATLESKSMIRQSLGIDLDSVVLLVRALNVEYKNLRLVVEALALLETKKKVTVLSVQEKGVFRTVLDKYQVVECGIITEDSEMAKLYNASDIFLMPSKNETFGLMAIEAMASGLACIISKGTVLEEVAHAPHASISVGVDDVLGMKDALQRLIESEDLRGDISNKARKIALENYSFASHAEKLFQLYEKVIIESHK